MIRRISIFISVISLGIIILSFQAYAAPYTFSLYGHVQDENGAQIPGTTIKIIEPIRNVTPMFGYNEPSVQSIVTDSQGNFQFDNITTNYSICGIYVVYPANQHPANPQYVYTADEIDTVNTSGIQYVNITRLAAPNPELTSLPSPSSGIATSHTFSVYGTVLEDNSTPITGATINLIEPEYFGNNSFSFNGPALHSNVTDSNGNFQFVNVTTNYSICEITISYPDNRPDFNPGNYFRDVNTSGIQYVNITRIRGGDATPSPSIMANIFVIIAIMLACSLKIKQKKK